MLLVFEGIHARPKSVIGIADELLFCNQPLKWLEDELLFGPNEVEDATLENEKTAVNSQAPVVDGADFLDQASVGFLKRNRVITQVGLHTNKAGSLLVVVEVFELGCEREIGQSIAVVRQKFLFALQILSYRQEALANVGMNTSIGEGNLPVLYVAADELEPLPAR